MVLPLMSEKCKCAAVSRPLQPCHLSLSLAQSLRGKTKRNKKGRKEMPLSPLGTHGNKTRNQGALVVLLPITLSLTLSAASRSLSRTYFGHFDVTVRERAFCVSFPCRSD